MFAIQLIIFVFHILAFATDIDISCVFSTYILCKPSQEGKKKAPSRFQGQI